MGRARPPSPIADRVIDLEVGASEPTSRADDALARGVWERLAGPLSDASMRLGSLRSRCASGSPEARELDEVIADIDRAFGAVMRAPPPTTADQPPPASSHPPLSAGQSRDAFERWVHGHAREPVDHVTHTSPESLLEVLATEVRPLPAQTARELGLEPGATYARAARLLLWARHAPGGPCCRSFRAAYYFLAGADALPDTPGATSRDTGLRGRRRSAADVDA